MKRRTLVTTAAVTGAALAIPLRAAAQTEAATPASTPAGGGATAAETGYIEVSDGLQLYYERHGSGGVPLLLLHGGLITIDLSFRQLIPVLAESREVIAVELEGHGHTALLDRPLSFEQMAADTITLLGGLGVTQADVLGYSTGGAVALQIAIQQPELVRKLVLISTAAKREGWAPEILASMGALSPEVAAMMEATPLYESYARVAPNPEAWPDFVTKMGELQTATPYDWTEQVAALTKPALLIYGDADSVLPEHSRELFQLLGGGAIGDLAPLPATQLAVLPGTGHSAVLMQTDLLLAVIIPFLDAPMPEAG